MKGLSLSDKGIITRRSKLIESTNEKFEKYDFGYMVQSLYDFWLKELADYYIEWNGDGTPQTNVFNAPAGTELQILIRDNFNCERDTTITLEMHPDFQYTLTSPSIICPGLPATVEIAYTPQGDYEVLWNNVLGNNPEQYVAEAGSTLDIVITNESGCEKDTSITIESHPPFNVVVNSVEQSCPGETVDVSLSITPSATYTIEWNGEEGNQTSFETEAGSEVSLKVTDAFGCISDTIISVEAFPEPIASFSVDQSGDCIPFEDIGNVTFINNSVNGASGIWDFGDGRTANFSPSNDVVHAYSEAGTYTIKLNITSAEGCVDSTSLELCTLPEQPVFIADIFSPNDDRRNDTLYVRGKLISRLEFRIYSRWGEVVFESNDVARGWDGNVRGVPAPSGSYYYTITATVGSATRVEEVGEIVLIR
jgi:gliding motility-associated-like protein